MSCSPNDLKEYFFGELDDAARRRLEEHLHQCQGCRDEFDRLRLTQSALNSLRDEELPRRIAFVSDKVFEPNWWQRIWQSGPRLGFASAAMLAAAIVAHGWMARPAMVAGNAPNSTAIEARVSEEVTRRVESAVKAAVAESEARQQKKAEELVLAARKNFDLQREADRIAMAEYSTMIQKRYNMMVAYADTQGAR